MGGITPIRFYIDVDDAQRQSVGKTGEIRLKSVEEVAACKMCA